MKPVLVLSAALALAPLATGCNKADADVGSGRPYKVGVVDRVLLISVRERVREIGIR